jgi:hypothetical protein
MDPKKDQKKDREPMTWEAAVREAEIIQRDFERALAEWYLFAQDDSVLDPWGSEKLHD